LSNGKNQGSRSEEFEKFPWNLNGTIRAFDDPREKSGAVRVPFHEPELEVVVLAFSYENQSERKENCDGDQTAPLVHEFFERRATSH